VTNRKFTPSRNTTIGGEMKVKIFHIPRNVIVKVEKPLYVFSDEDISIEGRLESKDNSGENPFSKGKDIHLTSEGNILVKGKIISGNGSLGYDSGIKDEQEISVAQNGIDGGDVELFSKNGSIFIERSARIVSGSAGNGGSAKGIGHNAKNDCEVGGNAVAVAGAGGKGGSIFVNCRGLIEIELSNGIFVIGNGGNGGHALAKGGKGGNAPKGVVPGYGGGVYIQGGDGGDSGVFNESSFEKIVLIKNRKRINSSLTNLKKLFSGGRGGKPGKTIGEGGKNGKNGMS